MEKTILNIISEFKGIYKEIAPNQPKNNLIKKASDKAIKKFETIVGAELPVEYKYFLENNDFAISFDANFDCMPFEDVKSSWGMMKELLDEGKFNDRRKGWWSTKWIPFAKDSCGNLKCINLEPGKKYQLIAMEIQDGQGPFIETKYSSFSNYLEKNLNYLKSEQYTLVKSGDGSPMIEIDSYVKPKKIIKMAKTKSEPQNPLLRDGAVIHWRFTKDELPPEGSDEVLICCKSEYKDLPPPVLQAFYRKGKWYGSSEVTDFMKKFAGDKELTNQKDIYAWCYLPTPPEFM